MSGQLKERFEERLFLYGLSLIRDPKRERERGKDVRIFCARPGQKYDLAWALNTIARRI